MGELHFDFRKSATRSTILEQLYTAADQQGLNIDAKAVAAAAGIPDHHHHNLDEVMETIAALQGVSDRVRGDMKGVYQLLTEAEAHVHGVEVDQAHFHEVGNACGIANALEICILIDALSPERITSTAVQTGSGQINCAHGLMDIPAPATAAILSHGIPCCEEKLDGELCTPTSAALIAHFVDEFLDRQ